MVTFGSKLSGGPDSIRGLQPGEGEDGMAAFDGEALVERFNTVWDAHDIDGIAEMFTDDVVFEASFAR